MKHSAVLKTLVERTEQRFNENTSDYSKKHLYDMKKMLSSVQSLERVAVSRNPKETQELHMSKVAKSATRLGDEVERLNKRAMQIYAEGFVNIDEKIHSQINLRPTAYAAEIRAALKGMTSKDRGDALNAALRAKDTELLGAIFDAPEIITGINRELKNSYIENIKESLAPELMDQRRQLVESFDESSLVIQSSMKAVSDGFDPVKIQQIEEQERKSIEANDRFEASLREA